MMKFFTKEKKFKKDKESAWLNINLYWEFAVYFMFSVIILALAFGYYLFLQINEESAPETSSTASQIGTVKKEKIDKVLEYFSARKQKSNQIINSPAPVVDPSL